jgi:aspartate carbamoyltransferase catalytic subunit
MGDDIKRALENAGIEFREENALDLVLPEADVVYQTRIQRERFPDQASYEEARGYYVIDQAAMDMLDPRAIVLHPLPRVDEIDPAIDSDPRAAYFRQAENGVYIRMALLDLLLG